MADDRQKAVATANAYHQGNIAGLDQAETRRLVASTVLTESSGGDLAVTNRQGYVGRYQAGAGWLVEAGYVDRQKYDQAFKASGARTEWEWATTGGMTRFLRDDGNWKDGLSLDKYKASADLQDKAFKTNSDKLYAHAVRDHLLDANSPAERVAGFLKASHLGGYGAGKAVLEGRPVHADANGTTPYKYYNDIARNGDGLDQLMARGGRDHATPARAPDAQTPTPARTAEAPAPFAASAFLRQQTPEVRAYLDLVAWKEVGHSLNADGSPSGYRERNGVAGSRGLMPESAIADNGTLPRDELRYNVGRYQMKLVDVEDMRNRYDRKIDDFSPESQDRIAVAKMRDRGVMRELEQGDIRGAIERGGKEWASLPGSPYGQVQRGYTVDKAVDYYEQRLAFHRALDRGQPPPAQAETPAASRDPMADGVLKHGERGDAVKHLQEALNKAGIRDDKGQPLPTTGYYGDMTEAAVRKYQTQHGLDVDGKAGRDTLGSLGLAQKPGQERAPTPAQPAHPQETQPPAQPPQQQPQPQPAPQPPQPQAPAQSGETPPAPRSDTGATAPPKPDAPKPDAPAQGGGQPSIADPKHPDHRLYEQAMANLQQLGPSGGFKSQDELTKAAAAVAADAKASGLGSIDHVAKANTPNGQTLLIAVEGNPTNPASKNSYIDYTQATTQTVAQSSRMAEAVKPVEAQVAQEQARSVSGR